MALRLVAVLLLAASVLLVGADVPRVSRDLPYVEGGDEAQVLDLYLPGESEERPPLVVFVHSRFWSSIPGQRVVVRGFVKPLQRLGTAVAVVRHRLAPEHPHPAPAQDVAAALRFLFDGAERYGYDRKRVFLAGHSSGAHLALLLALDPSFLQAHGLAPTDLAGVVGMSGPYDLDPEQATEEEESWYEAAFGDSAARRAASPQRLLRPDAPRILLLAAQDDIPGYIRGADRLASSLRDAGHPDAESYAVMGTNHGTILSLEVERAGTAMYLLDFLGLVGLPPAVAELRDAARFWRSPPFSTEPFWTSGAPVRTHVADDRFVRSARRVYQGLRHKWITFLPRRFDAIDLYELLDALGPERVGSGEWLVTTNALNEKVYLNLEELRAYRPVLVIGLDGERNPFRDVDVWRARREYSWRDGAPPAYSARPIGAFLYTLEPPPPELGLPVQAGFSIGPDGLKRQSEDPLAKLRDLEPGVQRVLIAGNGCVQCHSFRGVGSRAGHLRAVDGKSQGGYALPLEEYPPEVWTRFFFEPRVASSLVGAPLYGIEGPVAEKLHDLVAAER